MNQALVQDVVAEVMRRLKTGAPVVSEKPAAADGLGRFGIFTDVDAAALAANEAQLKLVALSMDDRDSIVKMIKSIARENAVPWAELEFEETKVGRLDHKIEKLKILELVPGVEFLKTNAFSGSNGICLEEFAPYGVIGCITPVTHSIPTLSANAINMIASGNAMVINPHPSGAKCAVHAVREYNKAIHAKFGIE